MDIKQLEKEALEIKAAKRALTTLTRAQARHVDKMQRMVGKILDDESSGSRVAAAVLDWAVENGFVERPPEPNDEPIKRARPRRIHGETAAYDPSDPVEV